MMTFFTVAGFLITFASQVLGLDVSYHQLLNVEQPQPVVAAKPIVASTKPNCPMMTNTSSSEDLNKIELSRVTGTCK